MEKVVPYRSEEIFDALYTEAIKINATTCLGGGGFKFIGSQEQVHKLVSYYNVLVKDEENGYDLR
jgi:hypothetical protein